MVELVALCCPVCGAPFSPSDERCNYCGSIIALKLDHPKIDTRLLNKAVVNEQIIKFRQRVRRDQFDEVAHYGLGVAYFNLGLIDESIDELARAARLMPENPNIQAQLAVVLKAATAQGNSGAASQLKQRVESILKLDPENLEGLLIHAELLADSGQYAQARQVLRRLQPQDPERAAALLERFLIARIEEMLGHHDWDEASVLIDELAMTNEAVAARILRQYLSNHRREMPVTLTAKRKQSERIADKSTQVFGAVVGFVFGLVALVLMISLGSQFTSTVTSVFIGAVVWFVCPFITLNYVQRMHKEKYRDKGVTINEAMIFSDPPDVSYLLRAADAIVRYQRGEMEIVR